MFVNILGRTVLLFSLVFLVKSDENTSVRKARFISFDSLDRDIGINLEFSIPFISIPLNKGMSADAGLFSSMGLPSVNVNPTSLAIGGAMLIGASILAPLLQKSYTEYYPQNRYSKLLNSTEVGSDTMLNFATHILENPSLYSCTLRVACWTGQRAIHSNFMNMWNYARSNKILSAMINSTAVEEAMSNGRRGEDCMTYTPCPLRRHHLLMLMNNFATNTNS
ncbi:uncharacterized protein LOC128201958 [Galleria mellonella]|uniref:Uncharacterized protein LOC128201958 n=1 Tax=Galleria mellonella TaxID=7137 RepID=A0ABM3MYQ5_GALME|nr:uncharacterized protein LOC128201958 [Galleria mellonella]